MRFLIDRTRPSRKKTRSRLIEWGAWGGSDFSHVIRHALTSISHLLEVWTLTLDSFSSLSLPSPPLFFWLPLVGGFCRKFPQTPRSRTVGLNVTLFLSPARVSTFLIHFLPNVVPSIFLRSVVAFTFCLAVETLLFFLTSCCCCCCLIGSDLSLSCSSCCFGWWVSKCSRSSSLFFFQAAPPHWSVAPPAAASCLSGSLLLTYLLVPADFSFCI